MKRPDICGVNNKADHNNMDRAKVVNRMQVFSMGTSAERDAILEGVALDAERAREIVDELDYHQPFPSAIRRAEVEEALANAPAYRNQFGQRLK